MSTHTLRRWGLSLIHISYEIRLMQNLYDAAVKQLSLKFELIV